MKYWTESDYVLMTRIKAFFPENSFIMSLVDERLENIKKRQPQVTRSQSRLTLNYKREKGKVDHSKKQLSKTSNFK